MHFSNNCMHAPYIVRPIKCHGITSCSEDQEDGAGNCIYPVRGKPYNAFPEPWKKARSFLEYIKAFFAFGKVFKLNFASQVYKSSRRRDL